MASAKLVFATPLWVVARGIRYSHYNLDKSDSLAINPDNALCPACHEKLVYGACALCLKNYHPETHIGPKDFDLIKRVGFKMKHESVLEFAQLVFDVEMSTKALLEESRHRIGVSQTVTSTRYALKKIDRKFEPTGDKDIDKKLEIIMDMVNEELEKGKPLDKVAMLLPQAYIYTLQLQFNLRSFLHFLKLRLTKEAHKTIRDVAVAMVKELPANYKELIFEDKDVKNNYDFFSS